MQLGIFRQAGTLHGKSRNQWKAVKCTIKYIQKISVSSRVAQWKRAGPITQRSEDQNLALLVFIFQFYS